MKSSVALIALILLLAGLGTYLSYPDLGSEVPVLYWMTDINPARDEQVAGFHRWLIKSGHGEEVVLRTADDVARFRARQLTPSIRKAIAQVNPAAAKVWDESSGTVPLPITIRIPMMELRVDAAAREPSAMVIRGVSGVAGDIQDRISGHEIRYFNAIGLLADLTDPAKRMGFDPSFTYGSITPEIVVNGRQYAFPCNVYQRYMLWVNKATFAKLGVPLPSRRWTFAEFEAIGKHFIAAANPTGQRRDVFFVDRLDDPQVLYRSLGLSQFNETCTRCALDDPRYVQVLELLHKWTFVDRIMPTEFEAVTMTAEAGNTGWSTLQLFNTGNYGMFTMGRFALIQLRQFGDLELKVVEMPNGGFPNSIVETRAASIYAGSKHKDLAPYFLSYLASEEYNMQIVDDADALPPNPRFAEIDAFKRPAKHPNEWGVHEVFSETAHTIGIGGVYSPFVMFADIKLYEEDARNRFMSDKISAVGASRLVADRVNRRIQRTIEEDESGKLKPLYDRLMAQQRQIEELRAAGRKVPLALIENPFLKRYYQFKGWAE